jgi:2-polyprenyl-6-methoxyphenol hydroxylase-like FAD-dependent oxidoreductase
MRRVSIVGAGQAGTLAAVGLANKGYEVTLYSDRTADSILNETPPTGTAAIFGDTVAAERANGVETFEDVALPMNGIHLFFNPKVGVELLDVASDLGADGGFAVDVRLKSKSRMDQLEAMGGTLVIEAVTPERVDEIAAHSDLTFVATGKADLAGLFGRDPERSVYETPQRYLGMIVVKGIPTDGTGFPHRLPGLTPVCFNFYADIGEFFWVPYYHKTQGKCWNLVIEAKPDGPLDQYRGVSSAAEMLDAVRAIVKQYAPWDWETMKDMDIVDDDPHCWLRGQFPPTVRRPTARTDSGHLIMALGDTAYAFDPIAGQGAGCGARQAAHYVDAVAAREDGPFDQEWASQTAEGFHAGHGGPAYRFNNILLEPLDAAGKQVLISAFGSQAVATRFLRNFNHPADYFPWMQDREAGRTWITETSGEPWRRVWLRGNRRIIAGRLKQKVRGRHFRYDDAV